jgi:hypothetical protein
MSTSTAHGDRIEATSRETGGFRSVPQSRRQFAAPLAALLVVAMLAAGCSGTPAAAPITPAPVAQATDTPTTQPTPASTTRPAAAIHVTLSQATNNDVTIDIADASGTLLTATSGTPADGASVEPYKLIVSNDNPTTLRLTWVGGPCDSANTLSINSTGRQFLLVQPECAGDSIVTDRILVLTFSKPVDAAGIEAFLQDGLDT